MDRAKVVDYYINKVDDKDFSILTVRQELERNNIDEQEIKVIVRLVDNELHRRIAAKSSKGKSKGVMLVGGAIALAGLILTLGTYAGIIEMGKYFMVAYGPILGGVALLFHGMARRK